MKREGDKGFILTGEEALRIIWRDDFTELEKAGGITTDLSIVSGSAEKPTYERKFILKDRGQTLLFERICRSAVPPVRISPIKLP